VAKAGGPSQPKFIVILVRADAEPIIMASALPRESAIATANLRGVNAAFLAETKRGMLRIFFKQREILIGQLLNVLREPLVAFPEGRQRV